MRGLKEFIVFGWLKNKSNGGFNDYKGDFSTYDECVYFAQHLYKNKEADFVQIFQWKNQSYFKLTEANRWNVVFNCKFGRCDNENIFV